jgi:hypothetical protein
MRSEPLRELKSAHVPDFEAADTDEPAAVGAALLAGLAAHG